jgi:integrase
LKRGAFLFPVEWSEIDLDATLWSIPAGKMKMKQSHIVPLSRQAIEITLCGHYDPDKREGRLFTSYQNRNVQK